VTDIPALTSETIHIIEKSIMNIDIINAIRSMSKSNFRHKNIVIIPKIIILNIAIDVFTLSRSFLEKKF